MTSRLRGEELRERLNPFLVDLVELPSEVLVEWVDAMPLVTDPARFDLLPKYLYARQRLAGRDAAWSTRLYERHIHAFNRAVEGDGSGKQGTTAYRGCFDALIDDVARRGFDAARSVVPLGENGSVVDGAHRVAACAAASTPVAIVRLAPRPRYDHALFLARRLDADSIEHIACTWVAFEPRAHVVLLYPAARMRDREVEAILSTCGPIYSRHAYVLSRRAARNLVAQVYRGETWVGGWECGFAGARAKAEPCFATGGSLRVFLLRADHGDLDAAKQEIRALCGVGNHSIHTVQGHRENLRLARMLLNRNSREFLARARVRPFARFWPLFEQYRSCLASGGVDPDDYCIDGSAVMAAYGMRECADLDVLHRAGTDVPCPHPLIGSHNDEARHYPVSVDEILDDPIHHLFLDGVKLVTPALVAAMKAHRGEAKDRRDVARMRWFRVAAPLATAVLDGPAQLKERIRGAVPPTLWRIARGPWRTARTAARTARRTLARWQPWAHRLTFRGYTVYSSPGTTVIDRVVREGAYEADTCRAIAAALQGRDRPLLLDIGANVGLVGIEVLSLVPDVTVVAFEPSPAALTMLQRTVRSNRLENRLRIEPIALADEDGQRRFSVHQRHHASGDGFRDTGRAGPTRGIDVPTLRLDSWWREQGRPGVDVVKIDIEGAELLVLRGGEELLAVCRPHLFLEINPANLRPYEWDARDVLAWLHAHGYRVEEFDGALVDDATLSAALERGENFHARPL